MRLGPHISIRIDSVFPYIIHSEWCALTWRYVKVSTSHIWNLLTSSHTTKRSSLLILLYNFHLLSYYYITGYKDDAKLHFLNIYFASPTFDKVINDEKANFETKLSAIGGTIGLFAGVSILSAVEILYFIVKIFLSKVLPSK